MTMDPSDKETRAIFLNFKELRCLEKNVQGLDLEKSYKISLINLDQKIVKVHYKRLKDKVTRIKSHLKPEEVHELKMMDEEENETEKHVSFSDIKIAAAARRLKLMPRARSAKPRLESGTVPGTSNIRTPRSPQSVQIKKHRVQSATTTSNTVLIRPTSATHSQSNRNFDFPLPRTIRNERKNSIFDIGCIQVDEINNTRNNISSIPTVYVSTGSNGKNNSCRGEQMGDTNVAHSIIIDEHNGSIRNTDNKALHTGQQLGDIDVIEPVIAIHLPNTNRLKDNSNGTVKHAHGTSELVLCKDANNAGNDKTIPVIKVIDNNGKGNNKSMNKPTSLLHVPSETYSVHSKVQSENEGVVDTLSVPGRTTQYSIRPMSVPATRVTDFSNNTAEKKRPMTAIERAIETKKRSVMEIHRASAMLKDGKTRTPYSCHELDNDEKKEKPFRSIRESINTTNSDNEVLDAILGEDLYKDMNKGMILGEVATSLYLEDKIDNFLEKVDHYVKENPNYVYDPDAPKKRIPRSNKGKKSRPKRNRLRRRQLERQLQQGDVEEMKKSRWLRANDDNLGTSHVNTLVIDQMKMINQLRPSYNDDSD